jgi:hypothetical protein
MGMYGHPSSRCVVTLVAFIFVLIPLVSCARNFVIVWEDDDMTKDNREVGSNPEEIFHSDGLDKKLGRLGTGAGSQEPNVEWDEFGDTEEKTDEDLDPGSWSHVLENEDRDDRGDQVSYVIL